MQPTLIFDKVKENPILSAHQWPMPVNSVFNSGACRTEKETVLLCRVEDTFGLSHLWVARSTDGVTDWRIDPTPLLSPNPKKQSELWGFEDARISRLVGHSEWMVTCTAYGPPGPSVYMFTTDFQVVSDGKTVLTNDKNASVFPKKFNDQWLMLHRPTSSEMSGRSVIEISRGSDLKSWGETQVVMSARDGNWWDSVRIGIGPPPFETSDGWLLLYHGARDTVAGAVYRVGVALLDSSNPAIVTHRGESWLLSPQENYERIGDVNNVVFPCGMVIDEENDEIFLYYGAADTCMALARGRLSEVMAYALSCPV
jgi:predicted GH43/DUF377 family glycosyl hydrolase